MKSPLSNEKAAAELVGALVLVSLIVVVIGIIAVMWFSQPAPQKLPAIAISISNQSKIIEISHDGGDPVLLSELFVLVNSMPHSYTCTNCGDSWSIGEILNIDYSDQTDFPNQVDVVYKGTRQQLLTTKYLGTMTPTLTPVTAPTTATPTSTATVIPAPVVDFTALPLTGPAPLSVAFTDRSTNNPNLWAWNFGDGNFVGNTTQNPTHLYTSSGTYTVSLIATNGGGSNTVTRAGYIVVTQQAPVANFTGTPVTGPAPLSVSFTDASTNSPTSWVWNFGDGNFTGNTTQNPTHLYTSSGIYTVSLNATNAGGSNTYSRTNYVTTTGSSFANFIVNQNVFVYGNQLTFNGNTVYGPGATIVILGPLTTSDLNGGSSLFVSTIYIDGTVNLNDGSAGLGSQTNPGDIYINGNTNLWSGVRSIYGDLHVNGNFNLKDAWIHNDVYVNGDLTLGDTPTLDPNSHIYYTGTITYPSNYNHPEILSKCIKVAAVPGITMPGQTIPQVKAADWYTSHGYVSSGALRSNMKIFANSYSSTSSWDIPAAENVVIIARNGDITLTNYWGVPVTGVLFAPKGKVTFNGGSFTGVVIARDGFYVSSGGTQVTFKNLDEYISNPDDYPF